MPIDRIQDRVQSTQEGDVWEVKATTETKEEKKRDEDKGRRQREQDAFGESSDFIQLLSKDPRKYRREKIDSTQISKFTFRGVSTHREKAILEVDITMGDGTLIKGAQVAVSRPDGMKFIGHKVGQEIVVDRIVQGGSILNVAIPQRPAAKPQEQNTVSSPPPSPEEKTGVGWFVYALVGVLGMAILALLYIFLTV